MIKIEIEKFGFKLDCALCTIEFIERYISSFSQD